MSAFSVTPLTDVPPPQASDFPDFIQFQENGTDLGLADADTLNFSTGLTATRGTGENSNVVTVTGGAADPITWRSVAADTEVVLADLDNGIESTSDNLELGLTINIPAGLSTESRPILIFNRGLATVTIGTVFGSGVQLLYRNAFVNRLAGQYATATLIQREADVWILCGDLEAAA